MEGKRGQPEPNWMDSVTLMMGAPLEDLKDQSWRKSIACGC